MMANKSEKCSVCCDMFTKKSNMYAHMRNVHLMKGEQDPVLRRTQSKTELCSGCGKAFTTKHNLQRHMQKVHDSALGTAHNTRIKCPVSGCEHTMSTYVRLRDHLFECHGRELTMEELQFSSETDFLRWKGDVETETLSLYVADTSKKMMKDGTRKQYYNCHRSYTYRGSGQNKRRLKTAGSIKIGTTCPARLDVTIKEGLFIVKFWKTHIGHSMDLEHIHLSKAARAEIADKMKQGLSFQEILNDIHCGKLYNVIPQRAQLVKRKDLHNIFRDFRIGFQSKELVNEFDCGNKLYEETQPIDNLQQSNSLQDIIIAVQNETFHINQPIENLVQQKDPPDDHQDVPLISPLKEIDNTKVPPSAGELQLANGEPILYFEEQHIQSPTVIHLTNKNHEFSVAFYEDVATEDCMVADQEIITERDQPVIYHEDVLPGNKELQNSKMCPTVKNCLPKSCDIGCPDCGQMFTKRKNLYAHMRNIHKLVGENDPVSPQKCLKTEICSLCGKAFINKNTMRRHRQKIHQESISNSHTPRIKCPDIHCHVEFCTYSQLRSHICSFHQVELVMEEMHFMNEPDFQLWKDTLQDNTVSIYVLDTSKKVMKDETVKMYYNCHRSHSYKRTGKNMRKLKRSGSNKIGRTCPSRIEVIERNGQLDVKFWKTHMGHSMDIEHTPLSKAVRSEIADMLKRGVTFERVLDLARNCKLQANQSQRIPLIKRKDLHNICRDFHISLPSLQSNDEFVEVDWCIDSYQDR